jgi:hypothetical protein
MMTPEGLSHTYTSFINTTSSIANGNVVKTDKLKPRVKID